MRCDECSYWNNESSQKTGKCRLNPPSASLVPSQGVGGVGLSVISYWPETGASDYCSKILRRPFLASKAD